MEDIFALLVLVALSYGFTLLIVYFFTPEEEIDYYAKQEPPEDEADWERLYCGTCGLREFERCPNCGAL